MATPAQALRNQVKGLRVSFDVIIRFRHELGRHWQHLALAILCALGYTGMRLLEPWPLKFVFDNVLVDAPLVTPFGWLNDWLGTDRMRVLMLAVGAVLFFAIMRGIFYYYQSVLTSRVGQEVVIRIRQQLFSHVQRLSLRFHNGSSTGDLLTRFTGDINNLRQLLAASLLSLISESIILIGFVTVMFIMNWQLALLAVITMPTILFLLVFYSGRIRSAARKQRRREGELASRLHETLANMQIVQVFTREHAEEERLRSLNKRSLKAGLKATRLEGKLNQGVEISVAVGMALTLWVGANQVIDGRLTAGELIVFTTYMQSFYRPMRRLSRVAERASKASSCVDRITDVLDEVPEIQDGPTHAGRFNGAITFENASFAYNDGKTTLNTIDLTIHPHQTVALVGPSGAGKSTLVSLLPRLYDATEGRITIDGQDVRDFTLTSLRENISIVPQDGGLFAGSIRDNIAYGNPDATAEDIITAARDAYVHDYIMSMPDGYDTGISERGSSLGLLTTRKIRQFPVEFGRGSMAETFHDPGFAAMGLDFFQNIGYRGFGTIEFKKDDRDDTWKATDLNPRWVKPINLPIDAGVNFPLLHYRDLTGENPEPQMEFRAGVRWLDAASDFASTWPLIRAGKTSPIAIGRDWLSARSFPAFTTDDLGPFFMETDYGRRILRAPVQLLRRR